MARRTSVKKASSTSSRRKKELGSKEESLDSDLIPSELSAPSTSRSNRLRYLIIAILVILGVLFLLGKYLVVAWVDKQPITIFSYYKALDQKYGKDLKEQLISEQLIMDEARKRGVSVSDSEVNDQIKKIEDQEKGASNLDNVLKQQGMTRDDLKKQIRIQTMIKKMFGANVSVSDAEVNKYIDDHKNELPEVNDSQKKIIKDQLTQQKIVDNFRTWLQQAQQSNRVART